MAVKAALPRRTWLSLAVAVLAGAVAVVGVYFASQISDGTTAAQVGATTPTATPRSAVVFGTPPPGAQLGSWTPVPRCPEPTPTPTPPATVRPTPTPPPDGWILTPDGWVFAPDKWTPAPTPTPSPTQTPTPTPVPAPWPCVPYDYPEPSGTPPPPVFTPVPTLSEEEMIEAKLRHKMEHPDSGTPVDYPRQFPIGGKTITVPPGAIFYTRLTAGRMFDVIERGESKVYIEKGEITRWSVAPEDEDEFRRLILEPLKPLQ